MSDGSSTPSTLSSIQTAGDIMTRSVATTTADALLPKAIGVMLERHVSGLPVLNADKGLVGILTEGDLLRRVELGTEQERAGWLQFLLGPRQEAKAYVATHSRVVRDVMTTAVLTVDEAAPLSEVVGIMQAKRVKRLPVMAGDVLIGMVSRSDLLRALASTFGDEPPKAVGDAAILEAVVAALGRQSWGSRGGIKVAVTNGIVDLDGMIFEEAERGAIRVTTQNVAGVTTVRDHLRWLPPN